MSVSKGQGRGSGCSHQFFSNDPSLEKLLPDPSFAQRKVHSSFPSHFAPFSTTYFYFSLLPFSLQHRGIQNPFHHFKISQLETEVERVQVG